MEDNEATPDLDELQQVPDEGIRVPVRLDQTVPVHVMPSRSGASRSYTVTATAATILVGKDLRRGRVTIMSMDANIYVGSQDEVRSQAAGLWPKLVPLVLCHTDEVYVMASALTSTVSVWPEHWAD